MTKWDFDENGMFYYCINGYKYKVVNRYNIGGAQKLHTIRLFINDLCKKIREDEKNWDKDMKANIELFLNLHEERYYNSLTTEDVYDFYGKCIEDYVINRTYSKYLLSEIPPNTGFIGMNKPRNVKTIVGSIPIGPDGKLRAAYKDVFLDLSLGYKKLMDLLIHELAHSVANHVTFRVDDHKSDFKKAERFLFTYLHKLSKNSKQQFF